MRLPRLAALVCPALAGLLTAPLAFAQGARPAAAVTPAVPAAVPHDDFRLTLFVAQQIDRFNAGLAATQNAVAAGGMVMGADVDMRVAEIPVGKRGSARPLVSFTGRMIAGERVLAQSVETAVDTATGVAPDSIEVFPDAKSVEMLAGLRIAYPIQMLAGVPQTAVYFAAEAGATFAEHMTGDLLSTTRYGLGFERMAGTFSGSRVEVLSGRNESFGANHASGRYTVHVLVKGALAAAEGATLHRSHLGAFVELEVDTDNKGGPDGVRALMGLTLDGDGVFSAVRGLLGM